MISVIIPAYNEASCIEECLVQLKKVLENRAHELLVSVGSSTDATGTIAGRYARVVASPKGRALQMNAAASCASGDILFFVHADMEVSPGSLERIEDALYVKGYDGGGFSNVFSSNNAKIKRLGRVLNVRLFTNDHAGNLVFFGDNGIFCKRSVFFALRGFKEIPIMEDYDFSRRMARQFKSVRIQHPPLIVSSRRHEKAGFFKTRILWILIRRLFETGVSPHVLARWYHDVR